jgi:hypothetical protein
MRIRRCSFDISTRLQIGIGSPSGSVSRDRAFVVRPPRLPLRNKSVLSFHCTASRWRPPPSLSSASEGLDSLFIAREAGAASFGYYRTSRCRCHFPHVFCPEPHKAIGTRQTPLRHCERDIFVNSRAYRRRCGSPECHGRKVRNHIGFLAGSRITIPSLIRGGKKG